jgi:ABC-2 type transport system ATP-binding protein
MEPAVQVDQVSKRYPSQSKRLALDSITLSVESGRLCGLVGPDGAGKTTLLRILATVLEASSGTARIAGFDVHLQAEAARAHLGYMPQNFSLYPDLSVMENLDFFAEIQGVSGERKKQRIETMLAFTRLESFHKRRAAQLSGGMKKKLALACALIHEPQVLILDEPTTGVDPVSRRELWKMLAEVVQQGVTVLVSTPYMDEAERCQQVAILFEGRLLVSGEPRALTDHLPFQVVEVKARPRKLMRQVVSETPGVLNWRPIGDRLRLQVPNTDSTAQKVLRSLRQNLHRASSEVRLLRLTKPAMEDVFVHLVDSQRGVA